MQVGGSSPQVWRHCSEELREEGAHEGLLNGRALEAHAHARGRPMRGQERKQRTEEEGGERREQLAADEVELLRWATNRQNQG